jgi:hypothetical protein
MTDSSFSEPIYPHSVFGIFLVMILIAVVVVVMMPKPTAMPMVQELHVVKNSVVSVEDDPKIDKTDIKQDVRNEISRRVRAKTAPMAEWSAEDNSIAEPFMNSEDGSSFGQFQKSLMFGREVREIETPEKIADESNFVFQLPTFLPKAELSWSSDVTEQEARSLARDAFQPVPQSYSPEVAEDALKGISEALLECAKVGVKLPEMAPEQMSDLLFWSKSKTNAAAIAKQIINRL